MLVKVATTCADVLAANAANGILAASAAVHNLACLSGHWVDKTTLTGNI